MSTDDLAALQLELNEMKEEMVIIQTELADLKQLSADIKTILEIVTVWNDGEGFVHTINRFGVGIKWVLLIGAGLGSLWGILKAASHFLTKGMLG
jgi:hypothetical protein